MGRWCLTKSNYMGGWSGSISNSVSGRWLLLHSLRGRGGKSIICQKIEKFC